MRRLLVLLVVAAVLLMPAACALAMDDVSTVTEPGGADESGADGSGADNTTKRGEEVEGRNTLKSPECLQWSHWFLDSLIEPDTRTPPPPLPADAPIVALIDSAVDATHPYLRDRILPGGDYLDNDGDPTLPAEVLASPELLSLAGNCHATMVASAMTEAAPGVRIAVYRVLDESCQASSSDVARAIRDAVASGARVIALPLGGGRPSHSLKNALDEALAADVLVVAAAGNNAGPVIDYPARRDSTLVVSAVDDAGVPGDFASYGMRVGLSDRGVRLVVAYPGSSRALASGTSLAAGRTAAAAAALRAARPELNVEEVLLRLAETAQPLSQETPHKKQYGAGITDLSRALGEIIELQ